MRKPSEGMSKLRSIGQSVLWAALGMWEFACKVRLRAYRLPAAWSRRRSPERIRCRCGWIGMRRQSVHGYKEFEDGDVDLVDECPRCGLEL